MRHFLWIFLAFFSSVIAEDLETPLLTPEELVHFPSDYLIGELVSPLSGQICLNKTDLIAKGAENLALKRTYIAHKIVSRWYMGI